MKKSTGIITLLLSIVAIVGLGYIAMFGVNASKTGAASNIKQGLDLAGGVSITYQVVGDEEPSAEDLNDTIYKLQKRVENYSTESEVYKEGSRNITVEIPGVTDANTILEELGKPIHSDEKNQKTTYVTLFGIEKSREIAAKLSDEAIAIWEKQGESCVFLLELTKYLLTRTF